MPTKRTRKAHERRAEISDAALYFATDGLWANPPENGSVLDVLTFKYPGARPDECREVWLAIRDELLTTWLKKFPGTRPSWWFLFDPHCPRISEEDIRRHGWEGWYFAKDLPDLRRRLGGIGDPAYEVFALVPSFDRAVPDHFVTVEDVRFHRMEGEEFRGKPIDRTNPPQYESEASYLLRHNLLTQSEKRRLKPVDYEPEIIVEGPAS